MAGGIAHVVLVGRLGQDAELRATGGGTSVANFSIAVDAERPKSGEKPKTEWIRVALFGKSAERIAQYLTKGTTVTARGRLQFREWTNREGVVQKTTEVVADDVQLIGSKPQRDEHDQRRDEREAAPVTDDDIPFAWVAPLLLPLAGAMLAGHVVIRALA